VPFQGEIFSQEAHGQTFGIKVPIALARKFGGSNYSTFRRYVIDEASSFFEKVQLHFQLADLLVEFVLLGVGLLAHLLSAVTEDIRQTSQRLFLPAADLGRVDAEHLRDLGGRLVRLDGLDGDFGLQAGWVLLRVRGIDSPSFSMPPTI
jgi:hypothetical protein